MSETAAHLVDAVLPVKDIRQWVLTFPVPIRLLLAVKPKAMGKLLDIAHSCIAAYYRQKAGLPPKRSKAGAVTLIQRFGGSLNVNIHFHQLFIDGAYELDTEQKPIDFWAASPPSVSEIEQVLRQIIKRTTRYLERQNIIVKDEAQQFQLPIDDDDTFSKLQASSITYKFATGPSKGKKALVLKSMPDNDHMAKSGLVAKNSGFSLHAGVVAKANERDKLARICRYIARPAVAEDRLHTNSVGDVIYTFKKPWDDGTTAIKLTPTQLMERLAALVPRPRVHLTRYHGVLGPHYKYRSDIVPKPEGPNLTLAPTTAQTPSQSDAAPESSSRISWARLLKQREFLITTPGLRGNCTLARGENGFYFSYPQIATDINSHQGCFDFSGFFARIVSP